MTSAITSSEMHLDRVSICQNKAASTAASLMAMDVSDREGGRRDMCGWWWWGGLLRTFKEAQKIAAAHITHHTHTRTHTTAAITNHLIQIFYKASLKKPFNRFHL